MCRCKLFYPWYLSILYFCYDNRINDKGNDILIWCRLWMVEVMHEEWRYRRTSKLAIGSIEYKKTTSRYEKERHYKKPRISVIKFKWHYRTCFGGGWSYIAYVAWDCSTIEWERRYLEETENLERKG
mgnify:CR=1 FL=1